MKLCDRCPEAGGCLLDYMGEACKHVRKEKCPEVQPNRAELISNMSVDQMATDMVGAILYDLCEDGVPNKDFIRSWLLGTPDDEEILSTGFRW